MWSFSNDSGNQINFNITANESEIGVPYKWPDSTLFNVTYMLLESYDKNGVKVLKSMLNITISQGKNPSLTCHNNYLNTSSTITLEIGGPGMINHHVIRACMHEIIIIKSLIMSKDKHNTRA